MIQVIQRLKDKLIIFGLLMVLAITQPCLAGELQEKVYSLDECLKLAYQNSEELKTAALNVTKARYEVKQAGAGFLPSLTYDLYKQEEEAEDTTVNAYYEQYGELSLSQNLYTGGKTVAGFKQARLELKNVLEDERQAKQELTYDVKEAFYQLWLATQKLKVAQTSYENMEKHYHNTQEKCQAGTVSEYELLQAEVNWKTLKPDLIEAKNEVSLDKKNLGILIGVKGDQLAIEAAALEQTAPEKSDLTLETALETAYRERPEMGQMKNEIEIAQLGVKIARADYYPTLALSGSYQGSKYADSSDEEWDKVWALKVDLSGTLFNGLETQAKVGAAKTDLKVQLSSEKQLRDEIRLKVEQGLQSLEESLETIEANQANIDLVKETLRLTQIKLEEGLATTTDLMDAQLDVDEALNGYYEGICNYLTAVANMDLVLGKNI